MSTSERTSLYNRECRDPVHGFIYLSEAEWAIVDCPTFQRLRDIRQLAMAHLVYPGATHTRFEHSLGCLHLSDLIYDAIERQVRKENCPDFAEAFRKSEEKGNRGRRILRLASLLHDLGHSPFSHTGEHLMPTVNGSNRNVTHEDMTARLIRNTEIAETLKKEFEQELGGEAIEEVIAVATKPELAILPKGADLAWYRFLNDILAGELGSDRMDYLLRDALHSGQSAGLFDHRKLIDSMTIVPPPKETGADHRLGLDEAGWLVGEQMVAARYLMYVALYFHKTKRIYELHLEDFLARYLEELFGQPCFPVDDATKYTSLTDGVVWAAIYREARQSDGELARLARPFLDRSHLRLAYELILADNCITPAPKAFRQWLDDHGRLETSSSAASATSGDAESSWRHLVAKLPRRSVQRVWNKERFDNLTNSVNNYVRNKFGYDARGDQTGHHAAKFFASGPEHEIWVYLDGRTRYLADISEVVSGIPDKIWRGRIYSAEEDRADVKAFCENWLDNHPTVGGGPDVAE